MQPISKPQVEVAPQVKGGNHLGVTITTESLADQSFRVVRLEVEAPSGQTYQLYERNLLLNGSSHTERIPLAENDPKGRWRVSIRDVASGQSQDASFEVV